MCYNEHWPTTILPSFCCAQLRTCRGLAKMGRERGLHRKFLFYPFLFHFYQCLLVLCVHTHFFPFLRPPRSPNRNERVNWLARHTVECDYLIFRKRFREILIGILCICFEANSSSRHRQQQRKRNCLNTEKLNFALAVFEEHRRANKVFTHTHTRTEDVNVLFRDFNLRKCKIVFARTQTICCVKAEIFEANLRLKIEMRRFWRSDSPGRSYQVHENENINLSFQPEEVVHIKHQL